MRILYLEIYSISEHAAYATESSHVLWAFLRSKQEKNHKGKIDKEGSEQTQKQMEGPKTCFLPVIQTCSIPKENVCDGSTN